MTRSLLLVRTTCSASAGHDGGSRLSSRRDLFSQHCPAFSQCNSPRSIREWAGGGRDQSFCALQHRALQVSEHHEVPGDRKPRRRQEDEEPSRFSTHRSRSACHGKTWAARQGKMGEGAGCLGVKEKDLRAWSGRAAFPFRTGMRAPMTRSSASAPRRGLDRVAALQALSTV